MRRDLGYGLRKSAPRAIKFLGVGDRQVRVIASDGTADRYGDVLDPAGCDLANYRRNPVVLAQHDSDQPIARCASITADSAAVMALIEFPAAGVSASAELYLGLLKERVLGAVSVGFLPRSRSPLSGGGWHYREWELVELSVVSVPANPSALVTERSFANARRDRDLATHAALEARLDRNAARRARLQEATPMEQEWAAFYKRRDDEELQRRDRLAAFETMRRAVLSW